jgi:protein-histidine N-methyltransferase
MQPLTEVQTSSLPSQIAYNTLKLENSSKNEFLTLGRREIFDVRTQLMAEDAPDHDELISGLEQGDLKPNFYEGGFKTWECALDLARLVLATDQGEADMAHVIELGCGTAVPTLALFARLLSLPEGLTPFRFTLADYNSTVLRMVTLPNLLLTWWLNTRRRTTTTTSQGDDNGGDGSTEEAQKTDEGELDIDSDLINAFLTDLAIRGITIEFISGGWSPRFVDLVLGDHHDVQASSTGRNTLVLASETIYAPSSLDAFSQTLVQLLRRAQARNRGKTRSLVAAKKVYFGVGGGIDEFLHVLRQQPLQDNEQLDTRESSQVTSEGVGRIILEVSIHDTSTNTTSTRT